MSSRNFWWNDKNLLISKEVGSNFSIKKRLNNDKSGAQILQCIGKMHSNKKRGGN